MGLYEILAWGDRKAGFAGVLLIAALIGVAIMVPLVTTAHWIVTDYSTQSQKATALMLSMGYNIQPAANIPNNLISVKYTWYDDNRNLPDFLQQLKTQNVTTVYLFEGHKAVLFWDDQFPAIYFIGANYIVYYYQ